MNAREQKRILARVLAGLLAFATLGANKALAQCTMQTQMQSAANTTQQQRLDTINSNMQALGYLSQLQTQCMQGFQAVPTQLVGSGSVIQAAITRIEQSACSSLAQQARNTAQSTLASAQSAVQQNINSMQSSVVNAAGGQGSVLGNATSQTVNTSTGGVLGNLSNTISRMFQ